MNFGYRRIHALAWQSAESVVAQRQLLSDHFSIDRQVSADPSPINIAAECNPKSAAVQLHETKHGSPLASITNGRRYSAIMTNAATIPSPGPNPQHANDTPSRQSRPSGLRQLASVIVSTTTSTTGVLRRGPRDFPHGTASQSTCDLGQDPACAIHRECRFRMFDRSRNHRTAHPDDPRCA